MKWRPESPSFGDIIRVSVGSVYHYGIYVDDNEVIQFGLPPVDLMTRRDSDITVISTDMDAFSAGRIPERSIPETREEKKRFSAKKTVKLARSRLGEGGYSIIHNNCEHFVYECVYGKKYSLYEDEMQKRWRMRPILDIYVSQFCDDIDGLLSLAVERTFEKNESNMHTSKLKQDTVGVVAVSRGEVTLTQTKPSGDADRIAPLSGVEFWIEGRYLSVMRVFVVDSDNNCSLLPKSRFVDEESEALCQQS